MRRMWTTFTIGSATGAVVALLTSAVYQKRNDQQAKVLAPDGRVPSAPKPAWNANWDMRYDPSVKRSKDRPCRHILLIRHGQYNMEGERDEDRVLTERGERQATETGRRLAQLNIPLKSLVSSTMTRALQTAEFITKEVKVPVRNPDSLLREGSPFPYEPNFGRWHAEHKFYVDGARIEAAFRKYFHRPDVDQTEDTYEVLVCHANVIRYFVCRALQIPSESWLRMSLKNGSITWISIRHDGFVSLRGLGDAGHFEAVDLTVK